MAHCPQRRINGTITSQFNLICHGLAWTVTLYNTEAASSPVVTSSQSLIPVLLKFPPYQFIPQDWPDCSSSEVFQSSDWPKRFILNCSQHESSPFPIETLLVLKSSLCDKITSVENKVKSGSTTFFPIKSSHPPSGT